MDDPFRLITYDCVPTKWRNSGNHHRSSVNKQPSSHRGKQQSELGLLLEKSLQSLIVETPSVAHGAGGKGKHDSVHETAPDESARGGVQDPAILSSDVFPGGGAAAALGGETGAS